MSASAESLATARKPAPRSLSARLWDRIWPGDLLRNRILQRVKRRHGDTALPYTLVYRQIFILPTLFGSGFALMLIMTALGGLNFNNNLALLLVFVTGAAAQLTTHIAYRNLVGLEVQAVSAAPVFAGETACFLLHLANPTERPRYSLAGALATSEYGTCIDLPVGTQRAMKLALPSTGRGWLHAPPLRLETRYPLGLFRAWSWLFPDARCLVYPQPARDVPPLPTTGEGHSGDAHKGEGDQVHGLRNYRPGDALKHIAWRTSARHDQLYSREMETPRDAACVLDYKVLEGMGREQRLSVLTAWVLMAEHRQLIYSLVLPNRRIEPGTGPGQRAACLEALALFDR